MRRHLPLPWIIRCSMRLYRWLLCLGPASYRRQYGDLTLQLFQACCWDAYRRQGIRGVLGLWLPLLSDGVAQMVAEQFSERKSSMNSLWQRFNHTVVIPMFGSLTRFRRRLMHPFMHKKPLMQSGSFGESPLLFSDESQLLSSVISSGELLDQRLLRDLLGLAVGEARRVHKEYLGTPHLFLALTRLEGSRTQGALRSLGHSPEQVSDAIRLALGSGKATSDTPIEPTRRCKEILQSAERNAIIAHSTSVDERAIAQAVLSKEDGILPELLTKRGINPSGLLELILAEPRKF